MISAPPKSQQYDRLLWVEYIKAIAMILIFLVHGLEQVFGGAYLGNPTLGWPTLTERINQLAPLQGYGIADIPINLSRYLGWLGDHGVQLFLIISGFGLTWGLLSRQGFNPLTVREFYQKRLARLYPLWWGAHIYFLIIGIAATSLNINLFDVRFWLSLVGIRFTPDLFYYITPSFWYFGLIIQLYLIFPLLWRLLLRCGPLRLLVIGSAISFTVRGAGLLLLEQHIYLDAWSRGAIFITRLPEFLFGMSLAAWLYRDPQIVRRWARAPWAVPLALGTLIIGLALGIFLIGMTFSLFLIGLGLFGLLYVALADRSLSSFPGHRVWLWIGQHSYGIFLTHHPFVYLLVPFGLASAARVLGGLIGAAIATLISTLILENGVSFVQRQLKLWHTRSGWLGVAARLAAIAALVIGFTLVSEFLVRQFDPQEVNGWGERPALEPDSVFGWKLIPSTVTRLRWASYDYWVQSNSLGFPGTEYAPEKEPGTLRILVTGDAFSSAEGVNTDQAWPRLLERRLREQLLDQRVEILNFAITGYGPNQYARVVRTFAPIYKPDIIIVEFFVNEYQDVLFSNEEFQAGIGFGQPSDESLGTWLRLGHLRRFLDLKVVEPLKAAIRRVPNPEGYFLGNIVFLERARADFEDSRALIESRLSEIKATADEIGAEPWIVMVPASVQVCSPQELAYYPWPIDLSDAQIFDLDQPQRVTRTLAEKLGYTVYDLREALITAPTCTYQPYNMHWTVEGHEIVAQFLTEQLMLRRDSPAS